MSTLATAFVRTVTAIASRTAGSRRSAGTRPSGTSVKSATSGSARNVSATPAASASRAVNPPRPARVRHVARAAGALATRRKPEPEAPQDAPAAARQDALHEAVRRRGVDARAPDRAHLVADGRLRPRREAQDAEAAARGAVVAEVREAGIGGPQPDLRDDAVDVRLEADGVRLEDRRELHPAQELARVGADRHAGGADRHAVAARAQAVDRAQPGRVAARGDEDEHVRRER